MIDRDWTETAKREPPEGVVVEAMRSDGHVQDMVRRGKLWFFPDRSMYVYYKPLFWKELPAVASKTQTTPG